MKKHISLFLQIVLVVIISANPLFSQTKHALVIHGGAGVISRDKMSTELELEYRSKLNEALLKGDSLLKAGISSTDVVVEVIKIMEESPLFNAGKGAVFTNNGENELDASIMEGKTLNAGAVAGVKTIKSPITAAREVMQKSDHVFLSGKGAEEFAGKQGLEIVPNSYFFTQRRYDSLQKLINDERQRKENDNHGTVGCVALDVQGNLSAGTSTGGMTNKQYGRIGDTPVIGAGTYANNTTCGISCTGHGEYYIRLGFARDIAALVEYKNLSVSEACREEIKKLSQLNGTGGVIALDKNGNVAMEFNTPGMFRAYIKSDGQKEIAIFEK